MDPFQWISDQCQISASQEEILNKEMAAMFSGVTEVDSGRVPANLTGIAVGSARRCSIYDRKGKHNKGPKTPRYIPMDPYQEISDQCKVSNSQEEILEKAIAAAESRSPRSISNDPYQEISDQCKVSNSQEEILHRAIAAAKSKRKSTMEIDSRIPQKTPKKPHGPFQRAPPAKKNLGFLGGSEGGKLYGASGYRDPPPNTPRALGKAEIEAAAAQDIWLSRGKDVSELDLGFFTRMKSLVSSGAFPDLQSLRDSVVRSEERAYAFFERMKILISRGKLPDLGFPKHKEEEDSSVQRTPDASNIHRSPAPTQMITTTSTTTSEDLGGLSQMNLKESGVSKGKILSDFYDRMKFLVSTGAFPDLESLKESGILSGRDLHLFEMMKSLISQGTLPDLGFPKPKEVSRVGAANVDAQVCGNDGAGQGFSESGLEKPQSLKERSPTNLDSAPVEDTGGGRDAASEEAPSGKTTGETNLGISESKGGGFSSKDLEILQKSIALLVAMKDASTDRLDKMSASISMNQKPLVEQNSSIRISGDLSGPEKDRTKGPAHEDLGSVEEDVGLKNSDHSEDTRPTVEFAKFTYSKTGNPPNYQWSTQAKDTVGIAETATSHRQNRRKLPPSLQVPSAAEKERVSCSRGKSSGVAPQNEIIKNLLDFANALSKESPQYTGDVDILEEAERAGYTFPRPRWWLDTWE